MTEKRDFLLVDPTQSEIQGIRKAGIRFTKLEMEYIEARTEPQQFLLFKNIDPVIDVPRILGLLDSPLRRSLLMGGWCRKPTDFLAIDENHWFEFQ